MERISRGQKSQKTLPSRPSRKSAAASESDDSDVELVEPRLSASRKKVRRAASKSLAARPTSSLAQSPTPSSTQKRNDPFEAQSDRLSAKRRKKSSASDVDKETIKLYRQMVQGVIKTIPTDKPAKRVAWTNADSKLERREKGNASDAGFTSDQEGMILSAKKRQKDPSDISGWNDFYAYVGTQKKKKAGMPPKR